MFKIIILTSTALFLGGCGLRVDKNVTVFQVKEILNNEKFIDPIRSMALPDIGVRAGIGERIDFLNYYYAPEIKVIKAMPAPESQYRNWRIDLEVMDVNFLIYHVTRPYESLAYDLGYVKFVCTGQSVYISGSEDFVRNDLANVIKLSRNGN